MYFRHPCIEDLVSGVFDVLSDSRTEMVLMCLKLSYMFFVYDLKIIMLVFFGWTFGTMFFSVSE